MNFSNELIEELKKCKGIKTDAEVAEMLPHMNKGNLSKIKKGDGRNLTEEQALFIANECNLNAQWVLVQLAEETAKSEQAKKVWSNLAKKISRSATAAALALMVIFSGLESKAGSDPVLA